MKIDSAFQIGKTHDICQDFALASYAEVNKPFVIVSDGCSSSPSTDVGSRILTFTAAQQLERTVGVTNRIKDFNPNVCLSQAESIAESLKISKRSIDATLIMAIVTDRIEIGMYGDGAIAVGMDNGEIFFINFEYDKGYPFYLSYLPECSSHFRNWKEKYAFRWWMPYLIKKDEIEIYERRCTDDSFFFEDETRPTIHVLGSDWNTNIFIDIDKTKWISVMSDGINSFYKTENEGTSLVNSDISAVEVVSEILQFKNFNGKFMQRRLNRFIKFCQKNNWYHADDISFGTIYFGDK